MKIFNIEDIQVHVTRKEIKSLRLSINAPTGEVRLSMPRTMSDRAAEEFIQSRLDWIRKQRERLESIPKQVPDEFLTGELHSLFGKEYTLLVAHTDKKQRVELSGNNMVIYVREGHTRKTREKVMKEWYRNQLKALIPGYISKWEPIMGVEVNQWGVKDMKTRWGTCNIRDKRIWTNLQLAKKDEKYLEYILVHEMTHLLERLHNQRFKSLMTRFLPGWNQLRRELNGIKY